MPTVRMTPTAGTMPIESIRETLLSRVRTLPTHCCPKVLHFIETLEGEDWSDEEWEGLCEEFEHSPEKAIAKAERRAGFILPKQ
jgi:hypothetical protein